MRFNLLTRDLQAFPQHYPLIVHHVPFFSLKRVRSSFHCLMSQSVCPGLSSCCAVSSRTFSDAHMVQNACVWSCALNKPALLAATASADFSCKLWNAISGEELRSWDHPHIVRCCHFSNESAQLATAAHDKAVRVFDIATEQQTEQITQPRRYPESGALQDTLRAVRWAADDKLIMMSYQNSPGVDVLDVRTGEVCQQWKTEAPVTSMNLSYCGNFVTLAAGTDVSVYECSSKSMKQVRYFAYKVHLLCCKGWCTRLQCLHKFSSWHLFCAHGKLRVLQAHIRRTSVACSATAPSCLTFVHSRWGEASCVGRGSQGAATGGECPPVT